LIIVLVSCFVFIINTRVALLLMFLGYFLIIVYFYSRAKQISFTFKIGLVLTFLFLSTSALIAITQVPYFKEKYTTVTFGYLD